MENILRSHIRKLLFEQVNELELNELRGLSNVAVDVYNQLINKNNFRKAAKVYFSSFGLVPSNQMLIISVVKNIEQLNNRTLVLKVIFGNEDDLPDSLNTYPVLTAIAKKGIHQLELILVLNEKAKDISLNDMFTNEVIKTTIFHELTHFITDNHNYDSLKKFKNYMKSDLRTINTDVMVDETGKHKIENLLYYMSQDELNSIIAQIAVSKDKTNDEAYKLFSNYKNMTYDQFVQEMNEYNPEAKITKRLYDKIMQRIDYFFRKVHKTFVDNPAV